jgi:polyisoprenoid-binding protein YceI
MNHVRTLISLFAVALMGLAFTLAPVRESVQVDTTQSVITWKAYKVTGSHTGTVVLKSGSLNFGDTGLSGGSFVIDMTSITNTDMSGGGKEKLENHLKSADFFNVESHPTASFDITKVVSRGTPGDYKVVGNVTIKGINKEIRFNAHIDESAKPRVVTADIQLDRSDFDVRFRSGSFFENLGDKTIYDEFDLSVKLVLAK